ncbi:MAG: low molecular weight protein-tyrosine-phosphatase [Bacteroidota bacterium]
MKILMVCLGNICRSPLAEGILKHKIGTHGLDWTVDSAGTGSWHIGEAPDHRSIAVANLNGIDIRSQRSRQIQATDLDTFDLVFAMDGSNYNDIRRMATRPDQLEKIKLIMNMADPGRNQGVPDPYYGQDGFGQVYEMLDRACEQILAHYT